MFFSSTASGDGLSGQNKYQLLIDAARYVDRQGFACVWTPERHFHAFGGLFPNPSVTSAALAMITERVQLRSGSLISPLHNPIRVVEEWSVVDNLSGGRVAISFGSGWNVNDFVFFPDRYSNRQATMYEQIEVIKSLWRGEPFKQINGKGQEVEVKPQPRPIQKELPIWITSSGNIETFISAGRIGANLLTHMEHQDDEALGQKIQRYRQARRDHGHDPAAGKVSLMLHTFLGEDRGAVKETVRGPMRHYLQSAINLERKAVAGGGTASGGYKVKSHDIAERDMEDLLDILFERYFNEIALTGTVEHCVKRVEALRSVGVDEIACLIDFIDDRETVMGGLVYLDKLRALCAPLSARSAAPTAIGPDTENKVSGRL